jgi:hypothetical protein
MYFFVLLNFRGVREFKYFFFFFKHKEGGLLGRGYQSILWYFNYHFQKSREIHLNSDL